MNGLHRLMGIIPAALLFAGCGGGSSDMGGSVTIPGAGTGLVTITSQSAPTVAGVVAEGILEDKIVGAISVPALPVPINGSGAGRIMSSIAAAPMPSDVLALEGSMANCAVSGTVTVDFTIADPAMLTPQDEFRLDFEACDDGAGTVVDGALIMTVTSFDGDMTNEQFRLALSVALSAFQVTQDGVTTGAAGTISVEIDTTMPPLTTIRVSTSALTTTTAGETETLSDLTLTISEDDSMFPTAIALQTSFRLSSPRLGGDVVVSTSLALQSMGEEYPFVGELRIMAANNAVIVLIALDANSVRLEIDIDGDGSQDESVDTTWSELLAAAEAA